MMEPNSPDSSEESKIEQSSLEEELQIIPLHQKGKKSIAPWWLIISCLLVALITGWGAKLWLASMNRGPNGAPPGLAGQPQGLPVKLETLTTQLLETSSLVVGTLEAPRGITVKSEVDGRVKRIFVQEGSRVRAGQVILTIESADLQGELFQAKAQLENAQARLNELKAGSRSEELALAQAQLDQAIARLNNAKQGARPEEIAQAQATVESAQAELDLAQQRVNRYQNLSVEGAISEDQFAEIVKIERKALASLTEAQRRLDSLSKGREADLQELEATVEQARQNLRRLQNGARIEEIAQAEAQVAQARAAMAMVEVKIQKTQIVAPFAGVVGKIPIKTGDYLQSGNDLTTITENNLLEVNLSVPVEQASQLRIGLPVEILDRQGQIISSGQINFISPDVTFNTQLVLAKATLENSTGLLFNQGAVQGKIIWEQKPGLLVPAAAISRLGAKTFVFVAESLPNPQGDQPSLIARQKLITLGDIQGNSYQVLDGLKAGEQIITAGIMNLRDEMPIMPLPPESQNIP